MGRVLATLIGFLGDIDLAEEATREAFAIAAERWPLDGTPANANAWLVKAARNRAIAAYAAIAPWRRRPACSSRPKRRRKRWTPRHLAELMPDEPEVQGLLAMMLLLEARREARFQDDDLVLLADQDRSLWDHGADCRAPRRAHSPHRFASGRAEPGCRRSRTRGRPSHS